MRFSRFAPSLLLLLPLCLAARAEPGDPLTDRFSLSVGTFFVTTGTRVRVDSATRQGTDIDVEDELGIDDTDSIRAEGYWRFADRHKIRLLYFDTSRHASRAIDRTINFRDTTYPIHTEVQTGFTTRVAEVAYEYAFLRRPTYELSGTIGIHDIRFELGLSAMAAGAGGNAAVALNDSADVDGPLPVVGLHGIWRFGRNFHLDAQAQFFSIEIDPYDGHIADYNVSLVWMPLRHFGLGLGYNDFVTRVGVSADRFDGHLRWHYSGARIFATMSF